MAGAGTGVAHAHRPMADTRALLPVLLLSIGVLGTSCWGRFCEHPTSSRPCGLNGRGSRTSTCTDGEWSDPGPCVDPDVCVTGATEPTTPSACGLNGRGVSATRTCVTGQWVAGCDDPDVCVDGEFEHQFCGALSRQSRQCSSGQWGTYGACDNPSSLTIDAPGRQDMVYDADHHRLYITTSSPAGAPVPAGEVRTYDLLARKFEAPLYTGGSFKGIDLSADGSELAVADEANSVVHLSGLTGLIGGQFEFEQPPFSVAFTSNTELLITFGPGGSGGVPLRRFNYTLGPPIENQPIATVRPETLLARSADNSMVAYVQPSGATGEWGRYRINGRALATATTGIPAYEIAISRTASQYAVATQDGLHLFDDAARFLTVLGQSGGPVPIGAAYSPVADELYLAWAGASTSIDVYSTTTLQKLRDLEPAPGLFSGASGRAFVEGRMRVSRDGALLFVTMGNNVTAYLTGR